MPDMTTDTVRDWLREHIEIAEKATPIPGRWHVEKPEYGDRYLVDGASNDRIARFYKRNERVAEHVAANDPPTAQAVYGALLAVLDLRNDRTYPTPVGLAQDPMDKEDMLRRIGFEDACGYMQSVITDALSPIIEGDK